MRQTQESSAATGVAFGLLKQVLYGNNRCTNVPQVQQNDITQMPLAVHAKNIMPPAYSLLPVLHSICQQTAKRCIPTC